MRPVRTSPALLLVLCLILPGISAAQKTKQTPASGTSFIGPDDGLAVISAALDSRSRNARLDCSHLVHEIYVRAGLSFSYVSSSDLYTGTSEFRRVTRPQPGDLVAWPGHVGIVISPAQHSFYSALSSGLGVASYDSPYWKERGKPRFLRYVKTGPAVGASVGGPRTLTPTAFEPAEDRPTVDAQAPRTKAPPAARFQLPSTVIVESARPTADEVSAALLRAMRQTEESLRGQNVFDLAQPLVIVDRWEVQKVKIKGSQGWVEVKTSEPASLTAGNLNLRKREVKQRWDMRRSGPGTWEVVLPEAVYLRHNSAVEVLAHQLATMTEGGNVTGTSPQKAQLAQLLQALLEIKN